MAVLRNFIHWLDVDIDKKKLIRRTLFNFNSLCFHNQCMLNFSNFMKVAVLRNFIHWLDVVIDKKNVIWRSLFGFAVFYKQCSICQNFIKFAKKITNLLVVNKLNQMFFKEKWNHVPWDTLFNCVTFQTNVGIVILFQIYNIGNREHI